MATGTARRSADTWTAATGILMLVLAMGGFALMAAGGLAVEPGASQEDIAEALDEPVGAVARVGLYLDLLGSLLLVVFSARVAAALRDTGRDLSLVPAVVTGSALLAVAASFGDKAAFQVLALRAGEGLPSSSAVLLVDLIGASFLLFQACFAVFVISAAAGAAVTGLGPAWLGPAGIAAGALALAAVAFPGSLLAGLSFPLLALWVLALSATLLRARSHGTVEAAA